MAEKKVSYGSIAGRTDASLWYVIVSLLYIKKWPEDQLFEKIKPTILDLINLWEAWEFNQRGLIYTPLSGNWMDEYLVEGYLLYDQCLRYWALKLCKEFQLASSEKPESLKIKIQKNYWLSKENLKDAYHPKAYQFLLNQKDEKAYFYLGFFMQLI